MKSTCKVRLKGHEFDLKKASTFIKTSLFSIDLFEDEYYILSDSFNDTKDTNVVSSVASSFLEKINGILKIKFADFRGIELDYLFVFEDENGIDKVAAMQARMEGRGDLTVTVESDENKEIDDVLTNSVASEIFHIYSKETSWVNLYKVYELIKDEVGPKEVEKYVTDKELSRFTGTAQSKAQIGDEARHASSKYKGHPNPMTLEEANELVKEMMVKWAESELGSSL